MAGFPKAIFWAGWVTSLLLTGLLLVWHMPFSPFSTPGAKANEAAVVFLMAMAVRWVFLAGMIVIVARSWAHRLQLSGWTSAGLLLGLCALHLLLGLLNAVLWNAWLSAGGTHTPSGDGLLAGVYFLIPIVVLLGLGAAAWTLPTPSPVAETVELIAIQDG